MEDWLPWVPEVFFACGGNLRCWPKADTSSAGSHIKTRQKPETALEKSLAPRVRTGLTYYCKSSRDCLEGRQNHGKNALRVILAEEGIIIIIITGASGSKGIL